MISPSGSDDTPAIQAAIDSCGFAELAPADFKVTSLNLTGRVGVTLKGCGVMTRLIPQSNVKAVIDCTGSSNCTLQDLRIFGWQQPVTPWVGILGAQSQGSQASDVLKIIDVRVDGTYSCASLYVLQVCSSSITRSQFYNYAGAPTAIFTANNFFGAQSDFQTINNANDQTPSDWTIVGTEFHNMNNGWAVWLGAIGSPRFYGGNISSQHIPVSVNGCTVNGAPAYPSNIIFDGTTFYSDNGIQPPRAIDQNSQFCTFRSCAHSMASLT